VSKTSDRYMTMVCVDSQRKEKIHMCDGAETDKRPKVKGKDLDRMVYQSKGTRE
jgi:hypothetical protein